MQAKYISYPETQAFSAIVLDYISGKAQLNSFYKYKPGFEGFAEAIKNRNFKGDRTILTTVIKQQYAGLDTTELVHEHINLLADGRTFTITTGHQLNIFTGPLYFIYKIVTAINLAKELKQQFPDYNFVPVYWMATEDHDFEEINHVKIEDKMLTWAKAAAGATGRLNVADIAETLLAYKGYLGISENGLKFSELVDKAYTSHEKLSDATRDLVNALFGKYGLVCIDADEHLLKKQFADIVAADITSEQSFKLINESSSKLEELGYKPQVNPREINFFYMIDGVRERIVAEHGIYQVMNSPIRFTEDELKKEISDFPERFSPNVVMRPVYQEVILPNLAYIGGGAEVTYWLQLKANFDHYGVDFPVLLLRNSAMVVDQRSEARMHILGISPKEIFQKSESLKNGWIKSHVNLQLTLGDEERAINAIFDQIKLNAYKIDKTLSQSADAAKTKALKLISRLEKKMLSAEKRKHSTSLAQIDHLKEKLFPTGVLQERVLNIAPMIVLYGDDFIAALVDHFKPLDHQFTVLFA
ncbi:bacillithiol biosynthesis cysteine-adding enzyme BshC [Pedobacter sp. MC2016-24]|uniref:bacillithiol biosynthesis cysteine-adding enzyme BshC n=1 Tax=Pedobacter sp. MC2016-24 TaxID=2780090 RepID=UPI00187E73B8|nr:bacillithiol biosynthesis cysteine-adding enzyme BshC [Pedobacter sp. MC2016-24]MBE9602609.1 bacillithiol biosynthesis cysteine-adding enzyme BshC [Pedobacter sp. MC2016-24]